MEVTYVKKKIEVWYKSLFSCMLLYAMVCVSSSTVEECLCVFVVDNNLSGVLHLVNVLLLSAVPHRSLT